MTTTSQIKSHIANIPLSERQIKAHIYSGDETQKATVIFLPDLTGVVKSLLESAEYLAAEGFTVIVPDLYSQMGGPRYCMRMFFNTAHRDNHAGVGALKEINEILEWSKDHELVDNERIGMVGQCLTGGFILHMALRPDVKAPVVFHHSLGMKGSGLPEEHTSSICQKTQGHFVKIDPFCPPSRVNKLLKQFGSKMEAHFYPDLPHGIPHLFRSTESGRLAWRNMLRFLKAQLLSD